MAGKAALVDQIKSIQRSDPDAKQSWWDYCDTNLGGVKDPNRHEADVLNEFLAKYNGGGLPAATARPAAARPSRAASAGGGGWGGNAYGPPSAGSWGPPSMAWGGGGCGPIGGAGCWGPPAAAAAWGGFGGGGGGGAAGGNSLADMVKTGQRHSEAWKSAWKNYCALYGTGKFDPTKYDDDFIVGFLNYVAELAGNELGGAAEEPRGFANGAGQKRSAPSSAMITPPAKRQAITFTAWGDAGDADAGDAGDAGKADLVDKIKALQRSDPEAKSAWWQFCNDNLGGVKDPNKHEPETLQQFLDGYS